MQINSLIVASFVGMLSLPGAASAEFYQWKDGSGNVHFTDNPDAVPPAYRNKVLKRQMETEGTQSQTPPATRRAEPVEPTEFGTSSTRDREEWQMKFLKLRMEKKMLEESLPEKRKELVRINRERTKFGKPANRIAYDNLSKEIDRDEARIKQIDQELLDLDMEASRAGVPMEWRR